MSTSNGLRSECQAAEEGHGHFIRVSVRDPSGDSFQTFQDFFVSCGTGNDFTQEDHNCSINQLIPRRRSFQCDCAEKSVFIPLSMAPDVK